MLASTILLELISKLEVYDGILQPWFYRIYFDLYGAIHIYNI